MKSLIGLILLLFVSNANIFAQEYSKQGGIKTKNGILLYNNDGSESYTLELKGEIELKQYPLIILNSKAFQLNKGAKITFGNTDDSILTNYQNWEHKYLEHDVFKTKLPIKQKRFKHQNIIVDFWYFSLPKNNLGKTPVLKTYYLNFVQSETVYGFSYSSILGDDNEAKNFLTGLLDSLRFYDKPIDIKSIREQIMN